jgi:hypothetical protein
VVGGMMYIGFETKTLDIDGIEFLYPMRIVYSETIPDKPYYLKIEDYPDYFWYEDIAGETEIRTSLWDGWKNYPHYTFNREKYDRGEDPFEPWNPYECTDFKHRERRDRIKKDVRKHLELETELKKMRKTVKNLIALMEAQGVDTKDADIEEFKQYSQTIEDTIKGQPKTQEYFDKIDLKRINGKE